MLAQRYYSYSRSDRIRGAKGRHPTWLNFPDGAVEACRDYWANSDKPRKERLRILRQKLRKAFRNEPEAQTFHALDARTGKRAYIAPIIYNEVNTGPGVPAVVGAHGYLYVGTTVTAMGNACTVAKLNPETGEIEDVLVDYVGGKDGWGGTFYTVMPDGSRSEPAFMARSFTGDEDNHYSIGGSVLYGRHGHGGWQGIELTTRELGGRGSVGNNAYSGFAISGRFLVGTRVCGIATVHCFEEPPLFQGKDDEKSHRAPGLELGLLLRGASGAAG